jgi:acyl-CoA thioesterase-1
MNKHPIFTLIFLCYLLSASKVWATDSILLLGDSVSASYGMQPSEGWVHLLNQKLQAQNASFRVINASVSGETTIGGLSRLSAILEKENVDHLLIELGGNDGLRGLSPTSIKNNLLQMIKIAEDKNIPVSLFGIKIPPNYGPRYNKMFEAVFTSVAEEKNIPLIPFFVEEIILQPGMMQNDGIHPSVKAQPIIAKLVEKELVKLMQ